MRPHYLKVVQWDDSDRVYVGYCPDLFIGGVCHGVDELRVYRQLCKLVAEEVSEREASERRLPRPQALVAVAIA